MNNAETIISRVAGSCLRCTKWQPPARVLQRAFLHQPTPLTMPSTRSIRIAITPSIWKSPSDILLCRRLSTTSKHRFRQLFALQKYVASAPEYNEEKGLAFQQGDLSQRELQPIFGKVTPPTRFANRLLRVLHGRRRDGTLDLAPPKSMEMMLKQYPHASEDALEWLRKNFPIDEDAAILARIEREESNQEWAPSQYEQQAQDAGLYGPQSGNYRAELAEDKDDVYGQSELDKIRAERIEEAEQEDEELQQQIDKLQAEVKEQQTKALAERPDQGLEAAQEVRPPNQFERWVLKAKNRATSKLTLESSDVAEMSLLKRLLPSAIFVALVCAGSYLLAQYWTPPKRSDRIYPDVSLSFATIGTLIVANLVVFGAWKLPFMWRFLNTYFIAIPAYPRPVSMLGNVFSHQSSKHLLVNMVGLLVFGLSLHEDVGRGTFLGIYLASGVLGSFASLANFALRKQLMTSSLGASGSIWGVMAAYCWIHANEKFSFVFIPAALQEKVQFTGWFFLSVLIISQIIGVFSPLKKIDYASHVAGIAVGLASAEYWKRNQQASGAKRDKKNARWYEIMLGKTSK